MMLKFVKQHGIRLLGFHDLCTYLTKIDNKCGTRQRSHANAKMKKQWVTLGRLQTMFSCWLINALM
jgi:hypothetical protein